MLLWLAALAVGLLAALLHYLWRAPAAGGRLVPAALRGAAITLLAALALDAPAGRARRPAPHVALDASASWRRATGDSLWREGLERALDVDADSVFLVGDSLRPLRGAPSPDDAASRVRPAVERALAAGRPLVLVTDGEIDDPDALRSLPAGSRIAVAERPSRPDGAVGSLDLPRSAVSGDTVELRATLTAGPAGAPAGRLRILLDAGTAADTAVEALAPFASRTLPLRLRLSGSGAVLVRAVLALPGDAEARNDTLATAIELSPSAAAVFVSSAPDYDARYALQILRGAVRLPTRAYFQVAPGQWRADPTLARVSEAEVRRAAADAPLLVLHGDSTVFGPPRALGRGALLLFAPPRMPRGAEAPPAEWFAVGAPASPLSSLLAGVPWDSLPPLDVAASVADQDWEGLETRRARRLERRVAIVGTERPRRTVIVAASGLWRWQFRGGAPADAFAALWGGIFDWLAAERADRRAAVPATASVREGEPVSWRRGAGTDSVVVLALARRGAPVRTDTLTLRFGSGATVETAPLAAGTYDVRAAGGGSVLVVNPSREWLPRRPTVSEGRTGGSAGIGDAPRLRSVGLAYLLVVLLLCAEWLVRRRTGLR